MGFITVCSQPGDEYWCQTVDVSGAKEFLEGIAIQRAYVQGLILKTKYEKLCSKLGIDITVKRVDEINLKADPTPDWYWATKVCNRGITHAPLHGEPYDIFKVLKIHSQIEKEYYHIWMIDNEWKRPTYLFDKVIDVLESI